MDNDFFFSNFEKNNIIHDLNNKLYNIDMENLKMKKCVSKNKKYISSIFILFPYIIILWIILSIK